MASATTTQWGINYNGILTDLRLTDKERFSEVFTNEYRNIPGKTFKCFFRSSN